MEGDVVLSTMGNACREALDALVHTMAKAEMAGISELRARFNTWADEVGLFAHGRYSFDNQVRNNDKVRVLVRQFLEAIRMDAQLCMTIPDPELWWPSNQAV